MYYSFYDYDLEFEDGCKRYLGYDPSTKLVRYSEEIPSTYGCCCCTETYYGCESLDCYVFDDDIQGKILEIMEKINEINKRRTQNTGKGE